MATLNVSDLNRQGKVYNTANVAGVAALAVSTTMTGLILCNPYGSGKKFIMIDAGYTFTTAPTTLSNIGLAVGFSVTQVTHTTPVIIYGADGSGVSTSSVAKADSSSTLPVVAVAQRWFAGTSGTVVGMTMFNDKMEGSLVLVPGSYTHFTTLVTMTGMGSFTWAEVPI